MDALTTPRNTGLTLTDEWLPLFLDAVEDYAIFMLDPRGCVATWNNGAQKIKGYQAAEIIGQHFSRFYTEDAVRSGWPDEELRRAAATGRFEDEGWRVRKDGTRFWANVVITAIRHPGGGLRGFAKITRDLTERRQHEESLRQSEQRFRLLLESIRDYAIFMLDDAGLIVSWNAAAPAITGYEVAQALGQPVSMLYQENDRQSGAPAMELQRAAAEGRLETEGWRLRLDGKLFWANVIAAPIRDQSGQLHGYVMVMRDMSARRRLEELERTSGRMTQFLATLAHELRNPLAPIRNAVSIMQLQPAPNPVIRNCRDMIDRQLSHLTRLVDDLLDVSRIATGKIELRPESLAVRDVIDRSIELVRGQIADKQQVLEVQFPGEPLWVHGDLIRLTQVVQNLLHNASKFTAAGGRIGVQASGSSNTVTIAVTDNGQGLSPGVQDDIFDLFVQDGNGDPHGGLGLGLTIARSIVQLHGGAIRAESAGLNRGSTFTVLIPRLLYQTGTAGAGSKPGLAPGSETVRILVIDDNRDSADSMAMLLGLLGHEVRVAYAGAPALAMAREFLPRLVLLDLSMPDMGGLEVLKQLRNLAGLEHIAVVAVTGFGTEDDIKRSLAEGFDDHLTKPIEADQLEALISRRCR